MNKGFTLIEVLISLAIILIILGMVVYSYTGILMYSNDLYLREKNRLMLLEYINYYSDIKIFPKIIQNNTISREEHLDGINLFNDGVNTRLKTFFGPIDINSVIVYGFNGTSWVSLIASSTRSGSIKIVGLYDHVFISYKVIGWDYIRDRRYNYGNAITLSYINPIIDSAITDEGIDIPISDINIFNASEGHLSLGSDTKDKWINFYYKTPVYTSFQVKRPNVLDCSYFGSIISFNKIAHGHFVLVNYYDMDNIYRSELDCINLLNNVKLSYEIKNIIDIKCLTIECLSEYDSSNKYRRKISYMKVIN